MKKITTLALLFFLAIQFSACKKEVKKEVKKESKVKTTTKKAFPFILQNATNSINFVAYKTTEKIPVKGMFTKIKILKGGEGNSIKEALNGAEFKIPVSSIETKDASRNFKIQKFFFNVMENTLSFTGKVNLVDDKNGVVDFTMNGTTQKLPFEYSIVGNVFSMKTIMNVNKWNAQNAIKSLNEACKELHKAADGVSKTWNDVAINITSTF